MASKSGSFVVTRVAIVLTCVALTAIIVFAVSDFQNRYSNEFFDTLTQDNLDALHNRFQRVDVALDGAAGLVQASSSISQNAWAAYVGALQIERKLPTIGGIGWIARVHKSDGSYDRIARQLARRGFAIHPPTDADESLVVQYISPEAPNAAAVGLDILFQPSQRRSVDLARSKPGTTLSEPFQLVQYAPGEVGFVLFRTFFNRNPVIPELRGLAYAPFRAKDMFANLSSAQGRYMELQVFAGPDTDAGSLIYGTAPAENGNDFARTETIQFYGQTLTFHWQSTPEFVAAQRSLLPYYIAFSGLIAIALIGSNTLSHARRTRAIEAEIEEQTRALKAGSDQTAAVIDNAVVGISVHDADDRILSANPAFLELFEIDESSAIGAHLYDFIPEMPQNPWEGTAFVKSMTASGKSLWLKVQVNEWRNESGERRYVVLIDDVTAEQAVTNRLREAEHRLNLALNMAEIGIYDIDVRTGRSVVSDSWVALMGLDRATMADNPQDDFARRIHPDDRLIVQASNQECIDGRVNRSLCEYRIEVAPGEWRWMKSNTSIAETDGTGKVTRLIGAQTDFTELYNTHELLRESRRQFQEILENSPVPLALLNEDGIFTSVNPAFAKLTGHSRDALLGVGFQTLIHPEDLSELLRANEQLRTGNVRVLKVEARCVHKDGSEVWMLLSVSRAKDSVTNSDFFIAQFVDISQRKEIEKDNREFFANMSHELRTPLTSVKGAIDLVLGTARSSLPDNVQTLLGIAQGNSNRLARLLNDLLDLEKVSNKRMRFHYGLHNLAELVSKAVIAAMPIAETREVRFETRLPPQEVNAWIDADRMEQVLLNLLSNAVKYSEAGQTVVVSLSDTDSETVISVQDAGPGILDSYRNMIFQPFSQVDGSATRKKGGTGLGLSIAKSLIENMGGSLDFDSVVGHGTEFRMHLPKALSAAQMARVAGGQQARILHLETDRVFSALLGQWLGTDQTLVNVASLEDALSELEHDHFHALIVNWDALGPDDGARLLRLRGHHPELRVIGLSEGIPEVYREIAPLNLAYSKLPMDAIVRKCLRNLRVGGPTPANVVKV